jgi:hypothetical protein
MNLRRHLAIQPRLVRASVLAGGFVAALALSGCGDSRAPASASTPVPQHAVTACGTNSGRGCSSVRERVDLGTPSFSHSTEITNPLFPISRLRSAVLLGHVGGQPFRTETTLLPGTTTVAWAGLKVRVLLSQYLAYLNGRITEVALDRYARADDGSVWYLGEDVFDYERGVVSATEGTWLAGREGPAAMIMPAHPQVGDVYRPENAPGIVFEEVTVKSVGKTLVGPSGPVGRAMIAHELHSDGSQEDKLFAPGYGEFRTAGDGDLEALALAVPADALAGRAPRELRALIVSARAILESARVEDWETASASLRRTKLPWGTLREGHLPQSISGRLSKTIARSPWRSGRTSRRASRRRRSTSSSRPSTCSFATARSSRSTNGASSCGHSSCGCMRRRTISREPQATSPCSSGSATAS